MMKLVTWKKLRIAYETNNSLTFFSLGRKSVIRS